MAAVSGPVRLQRCVVSPAGRHSASLIFLHGSGDSGQGLRNWIKQVLNQDLTFQHIKIIYPTAPPRPYTPMKGGISNVWFDRFKISNDCPEHLDSINAMCQVLTGLIDDEVRSGIKKSRILVGGFSMGGCMAMHLAYRNHRDVAGVFALSSFLNKASAVYQHCGQNMGTTCMSFSGGLDKAVVRVQPGTLLSHKKRKPPVAEMKQRVSQISDLEVKDAENNQSEQQNEDIGGGGKEDNLRGLLADVKHTNIHITGVLEGEERARD
ncbi:lysophospholipase-like protein 1 isoform X8 [Desmodus rotundus]|uniref:lysophospholipase-like protein 1 isoform X8 n=1 Tax=Desmodus rotundus TaxID=9430 RepID=UPI0023817530|nr:lysophospholipase-like protein 1 isoform X8 [Desmodus rotundus]